MVETNQMRCYPSVYMAESTEMILRVLSKTKSLNFSFFNRFLLIFSWNRLQIFHLENNHFFIYFVNYNCTELYRRIDSLITCTLLSWKVMRLVQNCARFSIRKTKLRFSPKKTMTTVFFLCLASMGYLIEKSKYFVSKFLFYVLEILMIQWYKS